MSSQIAIQRSTPTFLYHLRRCSSSQVRTATLMGSSLRQGSNFQVLSSKFQGIKLSPSSAPANALRLKYRLSSHLSHYHTSSHLLSLQNISAKRVSSSRDASNAFQGANSSHLQHFSSSSVSSSASYSPYELKILRLKREVYELLSGSKILKKKIGNFWPPGSLTGLSHLFLTPIRDSLIAAQEIGGEDWEEFLSEALLKAANHRVENSKLKKWIGSNMNLDSQITRDDFKLATEILKLQSQDPNQASVSVSDIPHLPSSTESQKRNLREDIEALLEGGEFNNQSIGSLPPVELNSFKTWLALQRLVMAALALSSPLEKRDGTFPKVLCETLESAVDSRVEKLKLKGANKRPRRVTLFDIDAAEELLYKKVVEKLKEEGYQFRFDQVPDHLFQNIPFVKETKSQLDRLKPEVSQQLETYRQQIDELWKNEDWSSESLYPCFPLVSLRDTRSVLVLRRIAEHTAAEEEGQLSGYPLIVKKAVRRAVVERYINHDPEELRQKRPLHHITERDLKRTLKIIEKWREFNPE